MRASSAQGRPESSLLPREGLEALLATHCLRPIHASDVRYALGFNLEAVWTGLAVTR
jgi:hypothetical protein